MNVIWKSYKPNILNRGYWDQSILEGLFDSSIWDTGVKYDHHDDYIEADGAVVVIAARHHADKVEDINKDLARYSWVLLILTGDEEQVFPIDKIKHPNIKVWSQTPSLKTQADRFLINGYAPNTHETLKRCKEFYTAKQYRWSFIGQVTHSRRELCVSNLRKMENGVLIETPGFTQGIPQGLYLESLAGSKVAPCPSGAVIPDTFRLYESLEAGCVPIVDGLDPKGGSENYFRFLLGDDMPLPELKDWTELPGTVDYFNDVFPTKNNEVFAWWQGYKRDLAYALVGDINSLKPGACHPGALTILVPTSPSPIHPSTEIIEETIKSIRDRQPTTEIIIMIDGVREQQEHLKESYQEYIRRLLWLCNFEWSNVLPVIFKDHSHQVEMTRQCLKIVKTPAVMFVEHDTPLCESIPFKEVVETIIQGRANMIRLHHEALILEPHKHLMLDSEPQIINDIPLLRTAQWSQRPHVASTEFYKLILDKYFSPYAKSMIEDGIHGKVQEAYARRGLAGWNDWKVWIYAPSGNMKRSYHIDGRKDQPKFDETFIY